MRVHSSLVRQVGVALIITEYCVMNVHNNFRRMQMDDLLLDFVGLAFITDLDQLVRDAWIAADQKALNAILAYPGNRLVSRSVPASKGLVVAPCVTQRKLKVDQATGRLADTNPFKSRHGVDGGRATAIE